MSERNPPGNRALSTGRPAKAAIKPADVKPTKDLIIDKAELSQTELDDVTGGCCTGEHMPR